MQKTKLEGRIKAAKLKCTKARVALLKVLADGHGPFSLQDLHQKVGRQNLDAATVYRCLGAFEKAKLVKRCEFGDGILRFEMDGSPDDHHHHVICRQCRQVQNFDYCGLDELEKRLTKLGYSEIAHSLEFFGLCKRCRTRH